MRLNQEAIPQLLWWFRVAKACIHLALPTFVEFPCVTPVNGSIGCSSLLSRLLSSNLVSHTLLLNQTQRREHASGRENAHLEPKPAKPKSRAIVPPQLQKKQRGALIQEVSQCCLRTTQHASTSNMSLQTARIPNALLHATSTCARVP